MTTTRYIVRDSRDQRDNLDSARVVEHYGVAVAHATMGHGDIDHTNGNVCSRDGLVFTYKDGHTVSVTREEHQTVSPATVAALQSYRI